MIGIDKEKCIGCGTCIDKCACRSIVIEEGCAVFHPEKGCMKCMHCAAACPMDAITYDGRPAVLDEKHEVMREGFPEELEMFLKTRRSYRLFRNEPVAMEEIEHALEVASWAPSARNQHPTKYFVIRGRDQVDRVTEMIMDDIREKQDERLELLRAYEEGNNKVFGSAVTAICAYARNNAVNPQTDTALKLETAELVLQARGIGTCWSGYLMRNLNRVEALREAFSLPENNSFYGCLLLGYPEEEYIRIPERLKRPDIKLPELG